MFEVAEAIGWRQLHVEKSQTGSSACSFSPDGRWLASSHRDGLRTWDLATEKELAFLPMGRCQFVAFHPTRLELITASDRGGIEARVLRPESFRQGTTSNERLVMELPARIASPESLDRISLDRTGGILAGVHDGTVRIVNTQTHQEIRQLVAPDAIVGSAIDPSGRWCVGWNGANGKIYLWDVRSGSLSRTLASSDPGGAAFNNDSSVLLTGSGDEYVAWDTTTWQRRYSILSLAGGATFAKFAFSADGSMGAVLLSQTAIRLFAPVTGVEFATL